MAANADGRRGPPPGGFAAHAAARAAALHEYLLGPAGQKAQGKPWDVVGAIHEFASDREAGGLPLIFGKNKLDLSREVLKAMTPPPRVVVEFGTFVGNSAVAWGASLRDFHGGDDGLAVYAFELDPATAQIARDVVGLAGLTDVVTVMDGSGADSVKKLVADGHLVKGGVDVVFFDHWKDAYLPDLKLVEQLGLLRSGTVLLADNTDFPGAPDYVEYVKGGGDGAYRYTTESLEAAGEGRGPRIVLVSTVQ